MFKIIEMIINVIAVVVATLDLCFQYYRYYKIKQESEKNKSTNDEEESCNNDENPNDTD